MLASHGARVMRPYLKGFGPTRFQSGNTLRSGQQAALGSDLLAFLDVLGLQGAIIAGWISLPRTSFRMLFNWHQAAGAAVHSYWCCRDDGILSRHGYRLACFWDILFCRAICSCLFSIYIQTFSVKALLCMVCFLDTSAAEIGAVH